MSSILINMSSLFVLDWNKVPWSKATWEGNSYTATVHHKENSRQEFKVGTSKQELKQRPERILPTGLILCFLCCLMQFRTTCPVWIPPSHPKIMIKKFPRVFYRQVGRRYFIKWGFLSQKNSILCQDDKILTTIPLPKKQSWTYR